MVKYANGRKFNLKCNKKIDLYLLAYSVGLFGGEGTKRGWCRGKTRFEFVNSNTKKIKIMINFIYKLGITKKRKIQKHYFTHSDIINRSI